MAKPFPSAPLLHLNRPDTLVFRLPTQSAVVQMVVQWRTEGFRTSTPNVVYSIFKNVFQQTSNIDMEGRSSVSRCGPKTPSKQTDWPAALSMASSVSGSICVSAFQKKRQHLIFCFCRENRRSCFQMPVLTIAG